MSKPIDDLILEMVDNGGSSSNQRSDESDGVDEYGPDLYKDEEDRRRLLSLPEVERERILSERSEERQRNLERLEVRKLLNDGRREDTTRRSTRVKGSGTSRALSELTRRREEKNKSRSANKRKRSPTPERQKKRHYSDESGGEHSQDEYVDTEESAREKEKKRVPTLEEIHSISMSRQMIERWLYAPFFEKTAVGAFVRIFIGLDPKKVPVYRLCQVLEIVPWHKTYYISDIVPCNKALRLKHGSAERAFPMDIISNSPVTQQEYTRYLQTCEAEHVKIPDVEHVKAKYEDFTKAHGYILNDKEVNEMIKQKTEVKGAPTVNKAAERARLQIYLEHAQSIGDENAIREIEQKIENLDYRPVVIKNVFDEIARRNKEIEAREYLERVPRGTYRYQGNQIVRAGLHPEEFKKLSKEQVMLRQFQLNIMAKRRQNAAAKPKPPAKKPSDQSVPFDELYKKVAANFVL